MVVFPADLCLTFVVTIPSLIRRNPPNSSSVQLVAKVLRQDVTQHLLRLDRPGLLLGDDTVLHASLDVQLERLRGDRVVQVVEDGNGDELGGRGVGVEGLDDLADEIRG